MKTLPKTETIPPHLVTLDGRDSPSPIISNKPETYVGLCATNFKARLANHKTSFKYESKSTSTALSTRIWDFKRKNIMYKIKWTILDRGQQYSPITGICSLCTCDKFQILFNQEQAALNQKKEIFGYCLHKENKLLSKIDKKKIPGT